MSVPQKVRELDKKCLALTVQIKNNFERILEPSLNILIFEDVI